MRRYSFIQYILVVVLAFGASLGSPVRASDSVSTRKAVVECFSAQLCNTPGNGDVLRDVNNLEGSYDEGNVLILSSHVDIHLLNGVSSQQRWLWYQGQLGQFSLVVVNGAKRLALSTLSELAVTKLGAVRSEIDKTLNATLPGSVRVQLNRVTGTDRLYVVTAQVSMVPTPASSLRVTFIVFEDGVGVVEGGVGIIKWNHYVRRYVPGGRGTPIGLDSAGSGSVSALIPRSPSWIGPLGVCALVQDATTRQVLAADWVYAP
jgi:hypothetical protein